MKIRGLPSLPAGSVVQLDLEGDEVVGSELLAEPNTATAAFFEILEQQKIEPSYPAGVLDEVALLADDPGTDDAALEDLRELPFVTIDNQGSRDLDQALFIRKGEEGHEVFYALADACHFIKPDTALFAEALRRGVTYYLPTFSVPMLPPALSEGLVSLNPRVDRRALVFRMRLDASGEAVETHIFRGRIHSRARLTYDGVQAFYDRPAESPLARQEYTDSLELLREVGEMRLASARMRDVVQFDRRETVVDVDPGGVRLAIRSLARSDASMYNEQISLLCNIAGAHFLLGPERKPLVQPVFRVHEAPGEEARSRLGRLLARLASLHGLDDEWHWRRGQESLADYLARLPADGDRARLRDAIERQILLSNQRSAYSTEPGQHYALRVDAYSRFSSPMREVVGIFTHKEALEKLGLERPGDTERDEALREQVVQSANRARERQRQVEKGVLKLAVDELLRTDLLVPMGSRSTYTGTVLGMRPSRIYVSLDSPPVEIKVYTDDLQERLGSKLALADDEVEMTSADERFRLRVGDRIELKTAAYDESRERWLMVPVS
ncbi:MAG: RNB domain-containing ribonuclease [Deltaproteobacteria bacterium]|nr:RNB domain-containing ribonuclease [Deltaproteobacteria bacterium]